MVVQSRERGREGEGGLSGRESRRSVRLRVSERVAAGRL